MNKLLLRKENISGIHCDTKEGKRMKVGRAKLINRPTKTGGKEYPKFFLYLSSYVVKDKEFPFEEGEELVVRIQGRKLIVEKT